MDAKTRRTPEMAEEDSKRPTKRAKVEEDSAHPDAVLSEDVDLDGLDGEAEAPSDATETAGASDLYLDTVSSRS
jgi:hypothetical protein